MTKTVNVLCMKWGTLYNEQHVNKLYSMVRRHLSRPFRFVCFTDNAQGLLPEVEARPLPRLNTPAGMKDTRWFKLAMLAGKLEDLQGTALFLDLDLIVVDSLDPFFELPGDFCVVRDADLFKTKLIDVFRPARVAEYRKVGNTSVFRYEIGKFAHLVERFERDPQAVLDQYRNEQEYITLNLGKTGQISFWPEAWCVSFKNHCIAPGFSSYWVDPAIPAGARIVLFAGRLKQDDAMAGRGGKFYRKIRVAPWMREHWR